MIFTNRPEMVKIEGKNRPERQKERADDFLSQDKNSFALDFEENQHQKISISAIFTNRPEMVKIESENRLERQNGAADIFFIKQKIHCVGF